MFRHITLTTLVGHGHSGDLAIGAPEALDVPDVEKIGAKSCVEALKRHPGTGNDLKLLLGSKIYFNQVTDVTIFNFLQIRNRRSLVPPLHHGRGSEIVFNTIPRVKRESHPSL